MNGSTPPAPTSSPLGTTKRAPHTFLKVFAGNALGRILADWFGNWMDW